MKCSWKDEQRKRARERGRREKGREKMPHNSSKHAQKRWRTETTPRRPTGKAENSCSPLHTDVFVQLLRSSSPLSNAILDPPSIDDLNFPFECLAVFFSFRTVANEVGVFFAREGTTVVSTTSSNQKLDVTSTFTDKTSHRDDEMTHIGDSIWIANWKVDKGFEWRKIAFRSDTVFEPLCGDHNFVMRQSLFHIISSSEERDDVSAFGSISLQNSGTNCLTIQDNIIFGGFIIICDQNDAATENWRTRRKNNRANTGLRQIGI